MGAHPSTGSAELETDLDEAWHRMLTIFFAKRDAMFAALRELQLTPPHGHALHVLAAGPTRMRDLADGMACDASYITGIVDRLEELGLAERRSGPSDRRVKQIALTDRGIAAAARIGSTMTSAPVEFQQLSEADRRTLARLMAKVVPAIEVGPMSFKPHSRHDSDQSGRQVGRQVSRRPRDRE